MTKYTHEIMTIYHCQALIKYSKLLNNNQTLIAMRQEPNLKIILHQSHHARCQGVRIVQSKPHQWPTGRAHVHCVMVATSETVWLLFWPHWVGPSAQICQFCKKKNFY